MPAGVNVLTKLQGEGPKPKARGTRCELGQGQLGACWSGILDCKPKRKTAR